ncbi:MAG: RDD family protein [Paracoccaceae bacterium]
MYSPLPHQFATAAPDLDASLFEDVAPKRLIAWLVDTLLVALLTLLIVPFTAFTAIFFLPALFLTVGMVYRTLSIARHSATPGMRLMAIELRTHRGTWFDLPLAFWHTLGYTLSMAFVLPQVISVALMALGPRGQGLTDLILGSVMVNRIARH